MYITTEQDAQIAARAIASIMREGKAQTVNGFRFKPQAGIFVMCAGSPVPPSLGNRFTIEQLGAFLWAERNVFNAVTHACVKA